MNMRKQQRSLHGTCQNTHTNHNANTFFRSTHNRTYLLVVHWLLFMVFSCFSRCRDNKMNGESGHPCGVFHTQRSFHKVQKQNKDPSYGGRGRFCGSCHPQSGNQQHSKCTYLQADSIQAGHKIFFWDPVYVSLAFFCVVAYQQNQVCVMSLIGVWN